jgi:hypothetical protein
MEDTKTDASTEPKAELEPWQDLSVLEDIEATNRPLSEFNFIKVANSVPRLYGLKNTKLRELFRLRVKYLKTLPIEKYVQWLRKSKATPSQSTQDLLLDYTANLLGNTHLSPSPSPSAPELNPAPSPKPAKPNPPPDNDTLYSSSSNSDFQLDMSDTFKPAPARATSPNSPARVPRTIHSSFGSPQFGADSPARPPRSTPGRSVTQKYANNWIQPLAGTIEDPRTIYVDETRPENNNGFDVALIPQKIVHGYARNVYCVRVDTAPGDHKKFEMTVPPGPGNQLLIRCLSRPIHYSKERKFHRDNYCAVSKRIHEQTERDFASDPSHAWIYYLLQFPSYVRLDNSVLSQDQTKVKSQKKGVS